MSCWPRWRIALVGSWMSSSRRARRRDYPRTTLLVNDSGRQRLLLLPLVGDDVVLRSASEALLRSSFSFLLLSAFLASSAFFASVLAGASFFVGVWARSGEGPSERRANARATNSAINRAISVLPGMGLTSPIRYHASAGPRHLVARQLAVPAPVRLLDVLEDDVDLVGRGLADLHHRLRDGGRELPLLVLGASRVPLGRDVGHRRRLLT